MFEAGVIIILLIWALIVLMLSGFVTGLIFVFFLISASLFWLAFLLLKIAGLAASVPVALYSLLTLGLAAAVWAFSEPSAFFRVKSNIQRWASERLIRRRNS
jgi:hypothetical protein